MVRELSLLYRKSCERPSLFSTKSYYDLLTNISLANQLALGGVLDPVVRFFPSGEVIRKVGRRQALEYFVRADEKEALGGLVLEGGKVGTPGGPVEVKDFAAYEDVTGFSPSNLRNFISGYFAERIQITEDARSHVNRLLNTPEYSLSVGEFSPNDITISVKNEKDGYLLYNDGWSRYWRAFDGAHRQL